jgi:hypothetical protein
VNECQNNEEEEPQEKDSDQLNTLHIHLLNKPDTPTHLASVIKSKFVEKLIRLVSKSR